MTGKQVLATGAGWRWCAGLGLPLGEGLGAQGHPAISSFLLCLFVCLSVCLFVCFLVCLLVCLLCVCMCLKFVDMCVCYRVP